MILIYRMKDATPDSILHFKAQTIAYNAYAAQSHGSAGYHRV